MPEVRFACRQYANAFASAKLVLGRREVIGRDPEPIREPETPAERKAYELLQTFAGGPEGQVEFLDRMGTYFTVPGDMIAVGAYDPRWMSENPYAKWDLWSTTEVRWDGQRVHIQTSEVHDRFQEMPDYIKHVRIWNRHPRRGWESDSPVRASLKVLELIELYDDRLAAEALSRLIGAGIQFIPQGLSLPTVDGDPAGGTPQDFLELLKQIAATAVQDRHSAAATVPILIEAAPEDIAAAKDGHISFWSKFDENLGDLQERAIRRWATGTDLPAEVLLGLSQATHWNSSLISEDKVQSFIIPALRRACGNLTNGWLRPALETFGFRDDSLVLWFDAGGIKTRVDLADEAQWAADRFLISDADTRHATGLNQTTAPEGEDLKRQMLLHLARTLPEYVPDVLAELGIETKVPKISDREKPAVSRKRSTVPEPPKGDGKPGPKPEYGRPDAMPKLGKPGRTAELSTKEVMRLDSTPDTPRTRGDS